MPTCTRVCLNKPHARSLHTRPGLHAHSHSHGRAHTDSQGPQGTKGLESHPNPLGKDGVGSGVVAGARGGRRPGWQGLGRSVGPLHHPHPQTLPFSAGKWEAYTWREHRRHGWPQAGLLCELPLPSFPSLLGEGWGLMGTRPET